MLALAILFVLVYSVGLGNFYRVIIYASPAGLISAVMIYSLSWILRTVRLDSLVKNVGANVETWELFKLYISGNALNVILPAKLGDAAVIFYLKMRGIGIGMSTAIAVQCRILDVLALLILSLPSAILLFREKIPEWISLMLVGSLIIAALPLGVVILSKTGNLPHLMNKKFTFLNKKKNVSLFMEKARDAYFEYIKLASIKRLFAISLILSLFIWLLEILTCYANSLALGAQVPVLAVVLGVSLANMGKVAPATPGSIGIYESILAAVLALFGVPMELAVPIAILDHAIKNSFTLALGVPATTNQGLDLCELAKRSQAQEY
ncbi:MAG: flippase-like domain-containing protein [Methanothrix sp.]|nr:flippase-like domain-containing protein [Methanothrix sp.]OYV09283.1 MAG: dolichol-P-glucose synthetase [Methanosaeta sp. NSP1]